MSALENANPTIRAASELPTRHRESSSPTGRSSPLSFLKSILPPPPPPDPFDAPSSPSSLSSTSSTEEAEPIDAQEIYDLIATISDPEHPLSLGSLAVVNLPDIRIAPLGKSGRLQVVTVDITPTIAHCSLATVIGLCVRVRLERALPPRFRVDVRVKPGTHSTADEVTKQLGDKERVAAALENQQLTRMLRKMMETCV